MPEASILLDVAYDGTDFRGFAPQRELREGIAECWQRLQG